LLQLAELTLDEPEFEREILEGEEWDI
jgi:hypothetical protein